MKLVHIVTPKKNLQKSLRLNLRGLISKYWINACRKKLKFCLTLTMNAFRLFLTDRTLRMSSFESKV